MKLFLYGAYFTKYREHHLGLCNVISVLLLQLLSPHLCTKEKNKPQMYLSWFILTFSLQWETVILPEDVVFIIQWYRFVFKLNTMNKLGYIILYPLFSYELWYGLWLSQYFLWPETFHNQKSFENTCPLKTHFCVPFS